jgi:hypothetical protein
LRALLYRLARCQRPGDSPATEQKPPVVDEWLAGRDARWYGETPAASEIRSSPIQDHHP